MAFVIGHAAAMILFLLALYPFALVEQDEPPGPELLILALSRDLTRTDAGALVLRQDSFLEEIGRRHPRMWLDARIGNERLVVGTPPRAASDLLARLPPGITDARFTGVGDGQGEGDVRLEPIATPAGAGSVLAGGLASSALSYRDFLIHVWANEWFFLPVITGTLTLLGILFVIPVLLRSLRPTAAAAARIDPGDLDRRLPEQGVVKELLPIVRAFNGALDRLAAGFESRRRFIADVAHELRTPLAVLNMHVDSLPEGGVKPDLQRSVYRLGQMVGQMLDAERFSLKGRRREAVDLVELARSVTAEVAPLAVSQGYDIAFGCEAPRVIVDADPDAVARAISNLLGNAVAHGGCSGTIDVTVAADGKVEVADQGPGVPVEARERIFEPFHRERWDRDGCGLGLHLVRQIMQAHGGEASVHGSARGATFRLDFGPQASAA